MSDGKLYRISELERLTGVPRRRIHFYIQSGALHKPLKTGQTMAYYDDSHRVRLLAIKKARKLGEPLFAIKEKLDKQYGGVDPRKVAGLPQAGRTGRASRSPGKTAAPPQSARRNSALTRERILSTGCDMFRENGYKNTRVNDITRVLNIGKGTFYFYFPDKKALFLACVPLLFEAMFAKGWAEIRQIADPIKRLERRFDLVLADLKDFCAILRLAREAMDDPDPNLQELGVGIYRSVSSPLEADIDKGIQRGVFYPVDIPMAANLMIASVEGLYSMRLFNQQAPIDACRMNLFNLLVYGLAGQGTRLFPDGAA